MMGFYNRTMYNMYDIYIYSYIYLYRTYDDLSFIVFFHLACIMDTLISLLFGGAITMGEKSGIKRDAMVPGNRLQLEP